jgi:hypothetical protein
MSNFDDPESLSLAEFCQQAKLLLASEDTASFIRFVLCGQHDGRQFSVDAIRNRIRGAHPISGFRDFDSLLGIDKHIRIRSSLSLYPVARKEDTLYNNIHLDYSFDLEGSGVSNFTFNPAIFQTLSHFSLLAFRHSSYPYNPQPLHWEMGSTQHDTRTIPRPLRSKPLVFCLDPGRTNDIL